MQTQQDLQREPTIFSSRLIGMLVAFLLFLALLYRQNNLALLTLLILLLMGGSKLWSRMSLANVFCSMQTNRQRLFPGETLSLTINIENAKFLPIWVRIDWPHTSILGSKNDSSDIRQETGLLWHQRASFKQDLVAYKRGCYDLGPSHIATSDVFGFFSTQKRQSEQVEIVVYPRIVDLEPVSLPRHDLFGTPGSRSPVGDPVYIIGTQEYQPARPARHIHWKASARQLKLQEKVFEPSEQGKVLLILDVHSFEAESDFDAFETTLEVMASLCMRLDQAGLAVGFLTNGTIKGADNSQITAGRGTHQLTTILEILGRLQMISQATVPARAKQFRGMQRGASWAYFCYRPGRTTEEVAAYTRAFNAPLVLFVWQTDSPQSNDSDATFPDVIRINEIHSDLAETT